MNFQDLHELLRQELLRRIEQGSLTGSLLARQAGFQQAHVSNFLNRKRALSLEGLDKVLASQSLTVEQILPLELTSVAAKVAGDTVEVVPVEAQVVDMVELAVAVFLAARITPRRKPAYWVWRGRWHVSSAPTIFA